MRESTKISSVSKDGVVIRQIQHNEADHLLEASTHYMESLYPVESNHLVDVEELLQLGNYFLGAFAQESAVGCVALISKSSYAEFYLNLQYVGYEPQSMSNLKKWESSSCSVAVQDSRTFTGRHILPEKI